MKTANIPMYGHIAVYITYCAICLKLYYKTYFHNTHTFAKLKCDEDALFVILFFNIFNTQI